MQTRLERLLWIAAMALFAAAAPGCRQDDDPAGADELWTRIQDAKYRDLQEPFKPILYTPQAQDVKPWAPSSLASVSLSRRYVIHSTRPPGELRRAVAATVADASPGASIRFEELKDAVRESTLRERLIAALSTSFGLLALILAAIGTYGVTAYGVARRQSEIGLRIALGATRSQVVSMVLWDMARVVAVGLCAGIAIALVVSRAARGLLVGLEPTDGWTLSAALAVNVIVALVATLVPAHRAARISPIAALRAN